MLDDVTQHGINHTSDIFCFTRSENTFLQLQSVLVCFKFTGIMQCIIAYVLESFESYKWFRNSTMVMGVQLKHPEIYYSIRSNKFFQVFAHMSDLLFSNKNNNLTSLL